MATANELKDAVLSELHDQVANGSAIRDDEGGLTRVSAPAAVITAALAFLKLFPEDIEKDAIKATALSATIKRHAQHTSGRMQ